MLLRSVALLGRDRGFFRRDLVRKVGERPPGHDAGELSLPGGTPPRGRKLRSLGNERFGVRVPRSPFPDAAYAARVLEKRQLRGVTAAARDSSGVGSHSGHLSLPPPPRPPVPYPPPAFLLGFPRPPLLLLNGSFVRDGRG